MPNDRSFVYKDMFSGLIKKHKLIQTSLDTSSFKIILALGKSYM